MVLIGGEYNMAFDLGGILSDAGEWLFGGGTDESKAFGSSTENRNLKTEKYLDISDEAIEKILSDLLAGDLGIANIFTKEKVSGLYDSNVAKSQADNFLASVVGELAKLKAKEISTEVGTVSSNESSRAETEGEKGGIVGDVIGDVLGSIF